MSSITSATVVATTARANDTTLFASLELSESKWVVMNSPGSEKYSRHAVEGGDGSGLLGGELSKWSSSRNNSHPDAPPVARLPRTATKSCGDVRPTRFSAEAAAHTPSGVPRTSATERYPSIWRASSGSMIGTPSRMG